MYAYRIFEKQQLISANLYGQVTFQEVISFNKELILHPRFKPNFSGIADFRNSQLNISEDEIRQIGRWNAEDKAITGAWAHLVNSPEAVNISRTYMEEAKPAHPIEIFFELQAAADFLNFDDIRPFLFEDLPV